MTDEKKIIKEAIDDIKPDAYMKTRLQAKIKEPKRKSAKSFLKPALSCTLALAVLAGVGTYGMTRDNAPVTSQTSNAKLSSHSFNIVAYAQDENGNQCENITLGENDVTTLKNYRVKAYKDSDGYQAVKSGCESGFAINAKNVSEVTFESERVSSLIMICCFKVSLLMRASSMLKFRLPMKKINFITISTKTKTESFTTISQIIRIYQNILTENRKMPKITEFIIQIRMIIKTKINFFWHR